MSRQIKITDGESTVVLLKDLVFTIAPKRIGTTAAMASGKTVLDIVGYKNELSIPTGWLSAEDLAKLRRMIISSPLLTVTYPSLDGDVTEDFIFDMPEFKVFKYGSKEGVSGVYQWYGVTLNAVQQGVVSIADTL